MSKHRYQVIRHTDKQQWVVWDTGKIEKNRTPEGRQVGEPFAFKQDAEALKKNLDRRL